MEATAAMDAEILADHDAHAGDGGAKRRQIMDGARTVFHQQGFDGASMNDKSPASPRERCTPTSTPRSNCSKR
jgi:hypothetical protein